MHTTRRRDSLVIETSAQTTLRTITHKAGNSNPPHLNRWLAPTQVIGTPNLKVPGSVSYGAADLQVRPDLQLLRRDGRGRRLSEHLIDKPLDIGGPRQHPAFEAAAIRERPK